MYRTHQQTIEASQRWLHLAIAYQSLAEKFTRDLVDLFDYPDAVFSCYLGYVRCMQMFDACWSHVDAMNAAYFRRKEYAKKHG